MGARRLDLAFHRIDGRVEHILLGTARPSRDRRHLARLFKERLDAVDPGLGVEDMILAAFAVEPLPPQQIGLTGDATGGAAALFDRLGNRLGLAALSRFEARDSHIPERASVRAPVGGLRSGSHLTLPIAAATGPLPLPSKERRGLKTPSPPPGAERGGVRWGIDDKPPRPIRLFEPPQPVEAAWLLPDDPPFRFTWRRRRHRVMRADGPERIAAEWWRPDDPNSTDAIRDYYRVEDEEGRRFWLFRAGLPDGAEPPRWYVHGVFA